jgi:hypothetical protein
MTFKIPSPLLYLGSLIISALLASLAYWVLRSQGLDNNSLVVLAAGLLIGHLVGVSAHPSVRSAARPAAHPSAHKKASTPATRSTDNHSTGDSGETVSLYVGNLAYNAQRDALRALFEEYGQVNSVRIMTDRNTRRPRGYGFVDMEANAGRKALAALDDTEFCGRNLKVSEAQQRAS